MRSILLTLFFTGVFLQLKAQSALIHGKVHAEGEPIVFASVAISNSKFGTKTDPEGKFYLDKLPAGKYNLVISALGYTQRSIPLSINEGQTLHVDVELKQASATADEVVVSGTMKEITRLASPVPVEVYSPAFFRKNPTPSIFDALQNINGVRPQLNCNVCNTGDIHINGLEGPYTMIMIDGMPIVSGLSSVYGLSGIPNALIERVEIVKGPASSLYGSEAVGGLINIITKKPQNAPAVSADVFSTSWGELNTDLGLKLNAGKFADVLTGINYFKYNNRIDKNNDNFTDVTLQDRISLFQKWNFNRKSKRLFSLAGRYNYEDRWGGDITWNKSFRGGDLRYGESIYTNRWELLGNYQLPFTEPVMFSFSLNSHSQNSVYGTTVYGAKQQIAFGQFTWDKKVKRHDFLVGTALRYTFYDDNTPATVSLAGDNRADQVWLPGIFVQDEIELAKSHKLLLGMRYDFNSVHKHILTPRFAYKWNINEHNIVRFNAGTGFRVVSLFTEEHAALTGAREVELTQKLEPERSYNANLNFHRKFFFTNGSFLSLDASGWYTHFTNQIIPDYDTNPDQIIYSNLNGFAVSRGLSLNADLELKNGLKFMGGASLLDVYSKNNISSVKSRPLLTEKWTATWGLSYKIPGTLLNLDYTGNIYGSMRLPVLGELDPRSELSPVWSLQNIQLNYGGIKNLEIYGGVKNLLNWTPGKNEPFIIARSRDPFDQHVLKNAQGQVIPSSDNPYAMTFDPTYVYAPNQGVRTFLGLRMTIK